MLTRSQIQRLAQRYGIGIQAQERDYIQHLLLFLLYAKSQSLVFKGGTALRTVYQGNRYSEDLDFNGPADTSLLENIWAGVLRGMRDFGVNAEIRSEWQSEVGYSFDVSYQGPLYDGRDRTKGKVRVDISLRQEHTATQRELVSCDYDDIRPFVLTVLSLEHILAEKIRALLLRSKARDVYDIWFLVNRGVHVDRALVDSKLTPYSVVLSRTTLENALENAQADWERDLRPLLPQRVFWEDALAGITPLLTELAV